MRESLRKAGCVACVHPFFSLEKVVAGWMLEPNNIYFTYNNLRKPKNEVH